MGVLQLSLLSENVSVRGPTKPDSKSYGMHVKTHLKLLTVAHLCDVAITDRDIYYKFYREVIRCLSSF